MKISRFWAVFAALCGALHTVVLMFAVGVGGSAAASVTPDDTAETIAQAFLDNTNNLVTGGYMMLVAAFLLIVFAGYLRSAVVPDEGSQWPATIAFGGGIVAAAVLAIVAMISIAQGQISDYGSDPAVARSLLTLGWNAMWMTVPGLAALTGGTTVVSLSYGTLPRYVGWLGVVATISLLTPFWGIGFVGALLWIAATGATLSIRELRTTDS